ncbi:LysR family transcriptional regulator [Vibrio makurazakiensis]|uniref:LysR family transcriptional regulator n=1 Tax=Vibrio makurazakiensis TaxID=2910250 RepID=UPI003D0DB5D0
MAKKLYDNLDLNLLRMFFILYQEKNMRKAAERMHVTQPAVSKALTKMRHSLDNELFVKNSKGLTPTPYAEELYLSLRPIMLELENSLNRQEQFAPQQLDGNIVIALSPFLMSALATKIYSKIRSEAPNVCVHFRSWNQDTQSDIENGKICLGISYDSDLTIKTLYSKKIGIDKLKVICRKDHPIKGTSLTPQDAEKYPIGTILASNWNFQKSIAEIVGEELGLKFNVTLRSELPSVLLEAVHSSDMLVPVSNFSDYDFVSGIKSLDCNWGYSYETPDIFSYYHSKNHNSPLTLWLVEKVKTVLQSTD